MESLYLVCLWFVQRRDSINTAEQSGGAGGAGGPWAQRTAFLYAFSESLLCPHSLLDLGLDLFLRGAPDYHMPRFRDCLAQLVVSFKTAKTALSTCVLVPGTIPGPE